MKKVIKKISIAFFAINFAFLGLGQTETFQVFASEAQEKDAKYYEQKEELKKAVNDRAKVVSTDAYNNYASADAKAAYENAISNGQAILNKGDAATREELATATRNINNAKAGISRDAKAAIDKINLTKAIERNRIVIDAAKFLLENAPSKVANVKDQLLTMIQESEALIRKAEAFL